MEIFFSILTSSTFLLSAGFWSIPIFLMSESDNYPGPVTFFGKIVTVIILSIINTLFFDPCILPNSGCYGGY